MLRELQQQYGRVMYSMAQLEDDEEPGPSSRRPRFRSTSTMPCIMPCIMP